MFCRLPRPTGFKIYHNVYPYKSPAEIKALTGCNAVVNGQFFESNGSPSMNLKVNGALISYEAAYDGYGWDNKDTIMTLTKLLDGYDNFISCTLLVKNGLKSTLYYPKEIDGSRGRLAIGFRSDGSMIIACLPDGSAEACTIEKLQDFMISLGCTSAIALDGGSSTTLVSDICAIIGEKEHIPYYLCLYGNIEKIQVPVSTVYRVQVGAFKFKDGAAIIRDKIRALPDPLRAGYANAYIRYIAPYHKVQVGAFSSRENAQKVVTDLASHKFIGFVTT